MAEIEIPYNGGYATINLRLPKKNITILRSKNPTPSKKLDEIIDEALSKPIGGSRLSKIVKPGKKIAIIFDDFTRPTPVSLIIPQILEELKSGGVSNKDVSFICANGMHAPDFMNEELLRKKVGDRIYEEYEVSTHDAYDYNKLKFVGVTNCLGTPLFINKKVAESDIKIAIGRIAPHGDVGYSGGAKMIMPGVAGIWSIIHNHTGSYPRRGILRNPLRTDLDECAKKVGLDFIINVVYNSEGQVVKAFAGDYISARLKGIEFGDRHVWGAKIKELADIVIASPGLEKDGYFMHSMTCLGMALNCVNKKGTIIVISSCSKGWSTNELIDSGWHVSKDILEYDYPHLLWLLSSKAWQKPHKQFQALVYYVNHIVKTCHERKVIIAGAKGITREEAGRINIGFEESIENALMKTFKEYGGNAKVTILPNNFTLPLRQFHKMN